MPPSSASSTIALHRRTGAAVIDEVERFIVQTPRSPDAVLEPA